MKLSILFGQRKEQYEGQHAPEAVLVWDEYSIDENHTGFEKDIAAKRAEYGPDMVNMRVINIEVDQDKIRSLLVGVPTVKSTIQE